MQFMTISLSVALVLLFFFVPETQYPRAAQAASLQASASEDRAESANETNSKHEPAKYETSKHVSSVEESQVVVPAPKSYLQQLNPWSGTHPNGEKASFLYLFLRPWPLVFYPAVAYSTYIFGLAISAIQITVTQSPAVFEAPPYNFTPGIQSLQHVPMMIGAAIGSVYGGLGTDILARYITKKNNGIFEPESRLPLLIGPLFIVPAGLLMYSRFGSWITVGMVGVVQNGHRGRLRGSAQGVFHLVRPQSPVSPSPTVRRLRV